jgi:hypothetical protein
VFELIVIKQEHVKRSFGKWEMHIKFW